MFKRSLKTKNKWIIILFFFTVMVYADVEFTINENILLNRGYTKFDTDDYFYTQIFRDTYSEILQVIWVNKPSGYMRIIHDIDDGFVYHLFYVLGIPEKEDLPNILAIVYLRDGDKIYGFYKKTFYWKVN